MAVMRSNGYGYRAIAGKLGISPNTVKSYCRRNGLGGVAQPRRKAIQFTGEITPCRNCGMEIHQVAKRKKKIFCCDKCRNEWWNNHLDLIDRRTFHTQICPTCGREFEVYGSAPRKYCSHPCYVRDRFGA
ncbi:RNA polymerase subunit sigma-70 [Eubacterium pyruvativorans]|uniref:RNA polymerase subunit sigma-70 n=1 Tax=Eubacterium pyruvativorans TaxID=155865 RepID=UPI003012C8CE